MTVSIIHLDDEQNFLEMVSRILETKFENLEVLSTTNPQEALEMVEKHDVECVVSDYEMPELDGLEFFGKIKKKDLDVPFILYTGKADKEVISNAIASGVCSYLDKGGQKGVERLGEEIKQIVG